QAKIGGSNKHGVRCDVVIGRGRESLNTRPSRIRDCPDLIREDALGPGVSPGDAVVQRGEARDSAAGPIWPVRTAVRAAASRARAIASESAVSQRQNARGEDRAAATSRSTSMWTP